MDIKNGITHSHDVRVNKEYADWIVDIKKRYRNTQIKAAIRVNSEQLYFNWCLGRDLVLLRAEERWGKGVVEQAALDLQAEFPASKGFSATNLFYMKKWFLFYVTYGRFEKVQQAAGELPDVTGFSPRNLWFMRQWFLFHCSDAHFTNLSAQFKSGERKLNQAGSQLERQKLKQVDSEIQFPPFFGLVPWMHHVLIIQKCEAKWGNKFYYSLSKDLKNQFDDAKGFSVRNLQAMRQFYESFPQDEITQQLAAQIAMVPWGHILVLLTRRNANPDKAIFYIRKTVENGWSRVSEKQKRFHRG